VDSDGRTFYCIVLGAENVKEEDGTVTYYQFIEPKRLLEWAFDSFERITLMDENLVLREVPVTLADSDHVLVKPVGSVEKTMPVDYDPNKAEIIVDLPESVEAPVQANTVMGTVTLVYEGEELGTLDLVTQNDVPRSETKYYMKLVEETITTWWFKAIVVGVVLFILVLIILIVVLRGRSRRSRYSYSSRRRRY
jgi:D-alanyl-D-alanine carboxypeptidase (penicillin-binding protein 5/6)